MSRVRPITLEAVGDFGIPALGVAAVHAAVTDTGVEQVITTGFVALDRARRITATAGGTAGDIKAIQVIVEGTDQSGAVISETLPAFTVNTAGTVTGALVFATVTSWVLPAHDGTGATTSLGAADIPLSDCHITSVTLMAGAAAAATCQVQDKQTTAGDIVYLAVLTGTTFTWKPGGKVFCKGGVQLKALSGTGAKVTVTVK